MLFDFYIYKISMRSIEDQTPWRCWCPTEKFNVWGHIGLWWVKRAGTFEHNWFKWDVNSCALYSCTEHKPCFDIVMYLYCIVIYGHKVIITVNVFVLCWYCICKVSLLQRCLWPLGYYYCWRICIVLVLYLYNIFMYVWYLYLWPLGYYYGQRICIVLVLYL